MPNEIRLKSNLRRLKEGKQQMDHGKSKVKGNHQEIRSSIPNNTQALGKRLHKFAKNVFNNEPVAKKAGTLNVYCQKNWSKKFIGKN